MLKYISEGEGSPGATGRLLRAAAAFTAVAVASTVALSATAAVSPGKLVHPERFSAGRGGGASKVAPAQLWRAKGVGLHHQLASLQTRIQQANANQTVPFWTGQITSPLDGNTYTMAMVGSSPYNPANTVTPTVVSYLPIIARVHFEDGTVLDPTKPSCGDTVSVANRFWNSPLFTTNNVFSNGVHVGGGGINSQLIGAFQRANFWSVVKGTNYGVYLKPAIAKPIIVDIFAPDGNSSTFTNIPATCGNTTGSVTIGAIDINAYDALVENVIHYYSGPTQLPILLTYNLVQTEGGGCCVLGYHSAFAETTGTQTYAVGSYIDSGIFQNVDDTVIWSHEMSEWMDDPFVQYIQSIGVNDDLTPAWGNTGQVVGCQNNLETGDPLTGVAEFSIKGAGGFTYHFQDLAFHDWFYRTHSQGTGGKFSFQGVFTTDAGPLCTGASSGD